MESIVLHYCGCIVICIVSLKRLAWESSRRIAQTCLRYVEQRKHSLAIAAGLFSARLPRCLASPLLCSARGGFLFNVVVQCLSEVKEAVAQVQVVTVGPALAHQLHLLSFQRYAPTTTWHCALLACTVHSPSQLSRLHTLSLMR